MATNNNNQPKANSKAKRGQHQPNKNKNRHRQANPRPRPQPHPADLTTRARDEAHKQMADRGLVASDLLRRISRVREKLKFHCDNCTKNW